MTGERVVAIVTPSRAVYRKKKESSLTEPSS